MDLQKREASDASEMNYDDDGWIVSLPADPEEGRDGPEDVAFLQTETLADDLIAGMRLRREGPPRSVAYRLFCDDARCVILVDAPIPDIGDRVRSAIAALPDEAILEPKEDWFAVIVRAVCDQLGARVPVEAGQVDVEELYWNDHSRRTGEAP